MAGFDYGRMQKTATRLMTRFNQGVVTLTKITDTGTPIDVDAPWLGNVVTTATYTLQAAVKSVDQKYVDGTLIVSTDDQITFAVPPVTPTMTDTFSIDGVDRVLKDLRQLPAAGTPVAYIAFVA